MIDTPEIHGASDSILRGGRLTELPVVSPDAPLAVFDAEDRDVLIQGDLAFVHVVRSQGSVLVQGSIRGSAAQPIRVEATGDIVVTGAVHHGHLTGKRILIGGRSCHSQHTSAHSVSIGSTLETGRVVTGAYEIDQRRIESCRLTLEQNRIQVESSVRRVVTEEKRLDKACQALRSPLDFNVGRIVRHGDGRVSVDLSSFYQSLEGRTDEQMELALAEFFAKGIVGVITRANRKYLINYPAREKVFMQLVRNLRELFEAVLERDRLQRQIDWLEARLDQFVDGLRTRQTRIEVNGPIAGETTMEFIVPWVVQQPRTGGYDFAHQTARVELHTGASATELVRCGTDGGRTSTTVPCSEMAGVRFAVADGSVLWESVREAVNA